MSDYPGEPAGGEPLTGELVHGDVQLRGEGVLVERLVPLHEQLAARWLLSFDSDNTVAAYRRDIGLFFDWCTEFGFDPLTVGRTHADGYRRWLDDRLKKSTRARKLSAVASFYKFGMQTAPELIIANPMDAVRRPKVPNHSETVGLTVDQARRLFGAAQAAGTWENCAVRVLLHTGIRVSELVTATTADIRREPDGWTLQVTRKGDRDDRIPLVDEAHAAVAAHVRGRTGPILLGRNGTGRASRQTIARHLIALAHRAGPDLPRLTPHVLRHTAATLAILAGESPIRVQRLLGHAQITTTMRYVHAATDARTSAAHGLAAALRSQAAPAPAGIR